MDSLFQKNVTGLAKHPMSELTRIELPKLSVVDDIDESGSSKKSPFGRFAQRGECSVKNEVLVDSDRYIARDGNQFFTRRALGCDRFFDQNGFSGPRKRQRCGCVQIGRHQDMGPLETGG